MKVDFLNFSIPLFIFKYELTKYLLEIAETLIETSLIIWKSQNTNELRACYTTFRIHEFRSDPEFYFTEKHIRRNRMEIKSYSVRTELQMDGDSE